MKINKPTKFQVATILTVANLATIPFNAQALDHLLLVNMLGGRNLSILLITLAASIAILTISRLIYQEKNTASIIKISLTSYILNIVYIAFFFLGTLLPANRFGIEFSSLTNTILTIIILSSFTNTVYFEKYLGNVKEISNFDKNKVFEYMREKANTPLTIFYALTIIFLGMLAYFAPSIRITLIWSASIIIWQLLYIYFIQPTLTSRLIK
jgi:hypothetical protein